MHRGCGFARIEPAKHRPTSPRQGEHRLKDQVAARGTGELRKEVTRLNREVTRRASGWPVRSRRRRGTRRNGRRGDDRLHQRGDRESPCSRGAEGQVLRPGDQGMESAARRSDLRCLHVLGACQGRADRVSRALNSMLGEECPHVADPIQPHQPVQDGFGFSPLPHLACDLENLLRELRGRPRVQSPESLRDPCGAARQAVVAAVEAHELDPHRQAADLKQG